MDSRPGTAATVPPFASDGEQLFARFAYAPNELGYCGPAESATLFDLAVSGRADGELEPIARGFSGAWPYLALLADLAGIDNPLDARVVRAYWTGGPLLDEIDRVRFGERLIESIGAKAGHYWKHLSRDLLPEAAPTHGFHVFGVYPWSRLLRASSAQPLQVLDNCRIRSGRVVAVEAEHVVVSCRRLSWDGGQLGLLPAAEERVRRVVEGRGFVADPVAGEWLALHWAWVCDRLSDAQRRDLQRWTGWQLRATNARLARERREAT